MTTPAPEFEELRISLERLRALLEGLVLRGLRACGPEQIGQLESYIEQLERAGAGHVAAVLAELREHMEKDNRGAATSLLKAQTAVRLLERLLTLRVVNEQLTVAVAMMDQPPGVNGAESGANPQDGEADDDGE